MPPKFAQDYRQRERSSNPDVPLQPFALSAAEAAYKVNHALPHRSTYQSFPKAPNSSSTATTSSNSNSNASFLPYRQRLVAAALASSNVEDPPSSNDSSSAPSSNAVSSNAGNSGSTGATSSSPSLSKGKSKDTTHSHTSSIARQPTGNVLPSVSTSTAEFDPDATYYDLLMTHAAASLPEPGPDHFERRRVLWTAIPPEPMIPTSPSPSRVKLEALLGQPGAVESDEVWRAGLKNVWKGLVGGNQLRQRLPLAIVLKILQAGWLRDGTWPEGLVAPAWGDEQQQASPTPDPSYATSHPTAPRMLEQQGRDDQRHTHEEEAYAAAIHARASAEHASGSIQMHPYAQMHIMGMGMNMGIPPGYSPSSGDAPEESYYGMPYAYAEATPPPEDAEMGHESLPAGLEVPPPPMSGCEGGRPAVESEMDTDEEGEPGDMEVEVNAGDGRHEGG